MAEGYASFRPPLHKLILERVARALPLPAKVDLALDVGCGAGLSTKALEAFARGAVGIDPAASMGAAFSRTAPRTHFVVAAAEAIPIRASAVDVITAAGSLNYTDIVRFFAEAKRVLVPGGVVVVYDFSPGRSFRASAALDTWFSEFIRRYPWPPSEAAALDPERLRAMDHGFQFQGSDRFEIEIRLTPEFYLGYMMTETNVAYAVRNGIPEAEIQSWCAATLAPVWTGEPREVLFHGYYACLSQP